MADTLAVELKGKRLLIHWNTDDTHDFYNILEVVRELPDRKFQKKTRPYFWYIPATSYHAMVAIERLVPVGFEINDDVKKLAHKARDVVQQNQMVSDRKIEGLYPYQVAAVDFINAAGGRAIIGDDVGLGKTVEALAWAWEKKEKIGKVLVVAPANVIYKWQNEVHRWTEWKASVVATTKEPLPNVDVHIMSYDIMRLRVADLVDVSYDLIVLDECQYLKNYKTSRVRATKLLTQEIPYILALSGTPMPNRPIELFNILNMLDKDAWGNLYSFGYRYCGGKTKYGMFKGATNQPELSERLKTIMVRRLKTEVKHDLPPLTRTILPVDVNLTEYRKVERNVQEAILNLSPDSKGYWINVLDKMNLLRKAVGDAKTQPAIVWARDFLEECPNETKLLIYAHHRGIIDSLRIALSDYTVDEITGDTSPRNRLAIATAFQSLPVPRVLLVTSAAREGIDLFGTNGYDCSNVLFVEREWTPSVEAQAEGRLHRTGQGLPVNAWYLVARHTVDEYIAHLVEQKRQLITGLVGEMQVNTVIGDIVESWRK